jgi:hypothetical protein
VGEEVGDPIKLVTIPSARSREEKQCVAFLGNYLDESLLEGLGSNSIFY